MTGPVEQTAVELAKVFIAAFRDAMHAEQVDPDVADRVVNRVTYGTPQPAMHDLCGSST